MGVLRGAKKGPLSPSDSSPNKLGERNTITLRPALLGEVPEGRRGSPAICSTPTLEHQLPAPHLIAKAAQNQFGYMKCNQFS